MRVAITAAVVVGVIIGIAWQSAIRPRPEQSPIPTPVSDSPPPDTKPPSRLSASPSELKAIFENLEDVRKQVVDLRAFISVYKNWAPAYESTRCLRLADEIESLIAKIQNQVLRASNGESVPPISGDWEQLQQLIEQFNRAGSDFKKAASQR